MFDSLECPECSSGRITVHCDYCLHSVDLVTSPDDESFYHKADFVLIKTSWDNTNVTSFVQGSEEEVLKAFRGCFIQSIENLAEGAGADDLAKLRDTASKISKAGFTEIIEIVGAGWWEDGEKSGLHVLRLEGDKFIQIV